MKSTSFCVHAFAFAIAWMTWQPAAVATTIQLTPQSDWFSVLSGPTLRPGDEIVLGEGTYSDARLLQVSQRGTAERPIIIRSADGANVIFRRPDARQNSLNLIGCQYLIIRGIEINGGSAGIRIGSDGKHHAKFITLEQLHLHHLGGVAVTANFSDQVYEALVFRRNHIHHTRGHGEAFYLGSNNNADGKTTGYIFDSIIENNYIHHLNGKNVSQGDGIELKDGCYNNIVRDNVIHDTNYPGILVYSADGKAPNVIERNAIWNSNDHGIQAAADAIVRNNVIFDTKGESIYCRDHQSATVGNLQIVHNTLLSKSSIRIVSPKRWSGPVVVANNIFAGNQRIPVTPHVSTAGNIADASTHGLNHIFPSSNSPSIGAAVSSYRSQLDFNGTARTRNDSGAYEYSANGNPAQPIHAGFK